MGMRKSRWKFEARFLR